MKLAERLIYLVKGSIMGHLVGDALGFPYRNLNEEMPDTIDMVEDVERIPAGSYTNVGAMSLCTMANINECKGIDINDLMEKFYDMHVGNYLVANEEAMATSETTGQAIKNYSNGIPIDRCAVDADDNQALSRILPIGLFYANENINTLIEKVLLVCRVTHRDLESQICCVLYCLLIRNIFLQKPEKVFDLLEQYLKDEKIDDYWEKFHYIKKWKDSHTCTGGRDVVNSFWSTWSSYTNNNDFQGAIISAVKLGNDTNVTAALTGGIMGLSKGSNDIPVRWLRRLCLDSEARNIVQCFVETVTEKNA